MDQPKSSTINFTDITADVVSAYVANNSVTPSELPALIGSVHAALRGVAAPPQPVPEKKQPAVSIRKSVTPDFLISLEDGKKYKSLKRHLTGIGMTPDQYREKWDLPRDFPMVAPNYAAKRSELAKSIGLGTMRKQGLALKLVEAEVEKVAPEPEAV